MNCIINMMFGVELKGFEKIWVSNLFWIEFCFFIWFWIIGNFKFNCNVVMLEISCRSLKLLLYRFIVYMKMKFFEIIF